MRNKKWLRYGLLSTLVIGSTLGSVLAACGDDDDVVANPKADSGVGADTSSGGGGDSSTGTDTGTGGDTGADTGPPAVPAKLILVHAATDLGPDTDQVSGTGQVGGVRVCFSVATKANPVDADFTPTPFPAQPADAGATQPYPGIFIGTGGTFPGSGADLETITIRPFMMNAKTLAAKGINGQDPSVPRCGKLLQASADGGIGGGVDGGLEMNKDAWQLADIPAGTLKKNHTYVLAVTGCTANAGATFGSCGPDNAGATFNPGVTPGPGNLKILILEIDSTSAVAADEFAAQAINISPQHEGVKGVFGSFKPTVLNSSFLDGGNGADAAGQLFPLTANSDELPYNRNATSASPLVKVKGLITATGYFAFNPKTIAPAPSDAPAGSIPLNNSGGTPPGTVQALTTGSGDATQLYVNGKAFTFVLVGVPQGAGLRGLHYLGFPNAQP